MVRSLGLGDTMAPHTPPGDEDVGVAAESPVQESDPPQVGEAVQPRSARFVPRTADRDYSTVMSPAIVAALAPGVRPTPAAPAVPSNAAATGVAPAPVRSAPGIYVPVQRAPVPAAPVPATPAPAAPVPATPVPAKPSAATPPPPAPVLPATASRAPGNPARRSTIPTPAPAPAPAPASETKHWRPLVPLLVVALLAVALGGVVVMALIFALSGDDDAPSGSSDGAASTGASPGPTSQSGGQPGDGTTPVDGSGLVAAAAVVSGDLVEVTESVSWPEGGPATIQLQVPDLASIEGLPAGLAPEIRELQVSVDGNPVEAVGGNADGSWDVHVPDGDAPETMEVRYLVAGVLLRSTPSQPGRALAVVAPLSVPALGDLPVHIRLNGSGVLNVACAGAPDATSALCARQEGDTWTATPPDRSPAVVVAQLDLS